MGKEFHSRGGLGAAAMATEERRCFAGGWGGAVRAGDGEAPAAGRTGRLARISDLLGLYFDLDWHLRRLPEKSLAEAAGALGKLAALAGQQERAVRELLAIKAAGSGHLAAARQRLRRLSPSRKAGRLERALSQRSWPLFWEAAAFLLGLALALFLT